MGGSITQAGGVHVVREGWADGLFPELAGEPSPAAVARHVDRLATPLLAAACRRLHDRSGHAPVPIVILRGGLLMLDASRRTFGDGPWGLLFPGIRGRGERVTIQRMDLPVAEPGTSYLLVDPIVNSGETVLAAVSALEATGAGSAASVGLACLFLTGRGRERIQHRYPALEIFTVWSDLPVDGDGWVAGIGFDAGDYAVGGSGDRRLRY